MFPAAVSQGTKALFFHTGEETIGHVYTIMQQFRARNIACEVYPEAARFDKQFKYAERRNIPYAVILGSEEAERRTFIVKDLRKGEQTTHAWEEAAKIILS